MKYKTIAIAVLSLLSACSFKFPPNVSSPIRSTVGSWTHDFTQLSLTTFKDPELPPQVKRASHLNSSDPNSVIISSTFDPQSEFLSFKLSWKKAPKQHSGFYGVDLKTKHFERLELPPGLDISPSSAYNWNANSHYFLSKTSKGFTRLNSIDVKKRSLTAVADTIIKNLFLSNKLVYTVVDKMLIQQKDNLSLKEFPISVKHSDIEIRAVSPDNSKIILAISDDTSSPLISFGTSPQKEDEKDFFSGIVEAIFPKWPTTWHDYILNLDNGKIAKLITKSNHTDSSEHRVSEYMFSPDSTKHFFTESGQIVIYETDTQVELIRLKGDDARWINDAQILTLENTANQAVVKMNTVNFQTFQLSSSSELQGLSALGNIRSIGFDSNTQYTLAESHDTLYFFNQKSNDVSLVSKGGQVDYLDEVWIDRITQDMMGLSISPLLLDNPTLTTYKIDLSSKTLIQSNSFSFR